MLCAQVDQVSGTLRWCRVSADCRRRVTVSSGEFRQAFGYLGVSALGDMLIPQRHRWRGVPEAVHQFGCGGTGLGGKHGADVAQVVTRKFGLPLRRGLSPTGIGTRRAGRVPSLPVNSRDSPPLADSAARCFFIAGRMCGGTLTVRTPAAVFGSPT